MAIDIKKNEWVEPVEVRENVVQDICDAFLNRCAWSCFHPYSQGAYRRATSMVVRHKNHKKAYGFHCDAFINDEGVVVRGCEMKAAFNELINAGYHIFRVHEYGSWMGYVVSEKPYIDCDRWGCSVEVTEFTDEID